MSNQAREISFRTASRQRRASASTVQQDSLASSGAAVSSDLVRLFKVTFARPG